jgi:hypothetical protein
MVNDAPAPNRSIFQTFLDVRCIVQVLLTPLVVNDNDCLLLPYLETLLDDTSHFFMGRPVFRLRKVAFCMRQRPAKLTIGLLCSEINLNTTI